MTGREWAPGYLGLTGSPSAEPGGSVVQSKLMGVKKD
jgi:hypothetical protein